MKRAQRFLFCVALPIAVFSFSGCGRSTGDAVARLENQTESESFAATGYVLSQDIRVEPVSPEGKLEQTVLLAAETEIALLERKMDPIHGPLIRIGMDVEEDSGLPTEMWMRASDLPESALIPFAPADESDDESAVDQDLGILKKMTYCYRYVKQYLLKTGQVKVYLPGGSAFQAAKILPKHGFRKTGHSPASARNGEVCVYAGGPQGHGHIEVKRSGKWWYGYGLKANPIRNRRFLGCFVK